MASNNYNSARSNTAGIKAVPQATAWARDPGLQGDPVPGVDVSIEQSPGGIIIAQTQTDGTGYYRFDGLPPGNYVVKSGGRSVQVSTAAAGPVGGHATSAGLAARDAPKVGPAEAPRKGRGIATGRNGGAF